jgi:hypothetical protein
MAAVSASRYFHSVADWSGIGTPDKTLRLLGEKILAMRRQSEEKLAPLISRGVLRTGTR